MTKEDYNNFMMYLQEQIDANITQCKLKAEKEYGKIEGMQLVEVQIVRYFRRMRRHQEKGGSDE